MNFNKKISWRIKYLLSNIQQKSFPLLLFNIMPRNFFLRNKLLVSAIKRDKELNQFIKIKKLRKYVLFSFNGVKILYPKSMDYRPIIHDYFSLIYNYENKKRKRKIDKFFFREKADGPYEIQQMKLERGDYVVDVGANIGMFSIVAAKKIKRGKIFAFEPITTTQELLRKNLKINKINNVKIFPYALGERNREGLFSMSKKELGDASGVFDRNGCSKKVIVKTLDELIKKYKLPKIDFIKADIEGMEKQMLIGAQKTIKRFKPKLTICSYHTPNDKNLIEKIILKISPEYKIIHKYRKIYAWTNKKHSNN